MSSIVIIGAGAAGLSAAADLARAGLEVIVLEARERVGGRVYTLHESGSVIEMGAEFIHGLPPETWSIVKAAALETQEVKGDLRVRDQSGLLKKEKDARGEAVWKRLRAFDSADRSFDQFVAECVSDADLGKARVSATRYVESFHAADPASISALSLARIERATASISGERSFRLPAGYDSLISWMFDRATAEGASIQCGVIVERVRWRRGSVEIAALEKGSGSRRVYQASRLLVTLPLGVLKQEQGTEGAVLFEPALSSKKAALTGSSPSQTVRLSLKFHSKWWRERFRDLAFAFSPRESFPVWWTSEPLDRPVIVAWAGGAKAERLLQLADDAIIDQAIEGLAHLFEVKRQLLENEFERAFMHDWRADPFARGSYSYILAGSPDAAAQLAEPIDETLFFAGEATNSEGHSGTVHGAIATGKRAARELIASL